jgi:HD-GYP domain-containing protein (c-di-GMP phosphodiesterase class II)
MQALDLAELIASLSYALDITEGQPEGHCIRCCWIGMHIGRELGLEEDELWALYYTLLLKDLGCSSNAARICELYLADDLAFKRDFKCVPMGLPSTFAFVLRQTGRHAGWSQRLSAIANIVRNGDEVAQELIQTRCDRGATIARRLRFPESVADGIRCLDEHFDGSGRPGHLEGDAIPRVSRIALLSQVVDVFQFSLGPEAALQEARRRSGAWFDPELVASLERVALRPGFWKTLASETVADAVHALEPERHWIAVDEDYLDEIAAAFGEVVDAKSHFTAGHSMRVGTYADLVGSALGLDDQRRRWLRRAAVLHDVGKLGVSNAILDKPGRLGADEWRAVQLHATYTEQILGRIRLFSKLAQVAGAHHERLDGRGYPRGIGADAIGLETRIITVADIFDAITATRPYRAAIPIPRALSLMRAQVGTAIDADCFAALERVVDEASVEVEDTVLAGR